MAVCACAIVSVLWGLTATAAAADTSLEVIGGTDERTVSLSTCPTASGKSERAHTCPRKTGYPYRGGKLTVLIHNVVDEKTAFELRYLPDGGEGPLALPGGSNRIFLLEGGTPVIETAAETASERTLTVNGGESLPLSIGFALPLSESSSSIDGTLLVSVAGEQPLSVPVSGETRTFKGVTVVPSTLPIDSSKGNAKITLQGLELLEYLRSHGGEALRAILYGDRGEATEAMLTLPTAKEVKADEGVAKGQQSEYQARPTVSLSDSNPPAGKYTGTLLLPDLPADGGSISVELHSHKPFILLVFLVFLGIVGAGIGSRLVTTASRRKRLNEVLDQTHDAYRHVLASGDTASWRLEDLLGEDSPLTNSKEPLAGRLQGLPALRWSIGEARSSADLDEDAGRALDMIARMQRWLRVEPLARRLALVATEETAGPTLPEEEETKEDGTKTTKPALAWGDSNTLSNTRALLEMAQREPANSDKADDLVARLIFQIEWHTGVAAAWAATAGDSIRGKEVRALEEALGDGSKAEKREPSEQDDLLARLQGALTKRKVTVPEIGEIEGENVGQEGRKLGITPVRWDASANLFTGWATLDAPSYGQLARRAATSSRSIYMPGPADLWREIKLTNLYDWAWTVAILAVASVAYGTATYDDTWGTHADLGTALLAGFLGKVTVNWAVLPIFQSIRLRKAEGGSS